MTPDKTAELDGALNLLSGFLPFIEKVLPEHAQGIAQAFSLTRDVIRALERTANIDDARAYLATQIEAAWQAKLDLLPPLADPEDPK